MPTLTNPSSLPAPAVSVVIPSFGSARTLRRCVAAILEQETDEIFEVILVHSGMAPPALDGDQWHRIRQINYARRLLPGEARNVGIRMARAPWVLFIDADCIADREWLDWLLTTARREGVCGVGGAVRNGSSHHPVAWAMHFVEFGQWLPRRSRPEVTSNFPSCSALYRRSTLLELGGFSIDLFPGEDTVLNARLSRAGYRLMWHPTAGVAHVHTRTLRGALNHCRRLGATYGRGCREHGLPHLDLLRLPVWMIGLAVLAGRYGAIARRLLYRDWWMLLLYVLLSPVILAMLIAWAAGFGQQRVRGVRWILSRGPTKRRPERILLKEK